MKNLFYYLLCFFISQSVFADVICDAPTDYFAKYEPNTYECETGEFLPANTSGCRQCPSEYICNGGTFNFNPDVFQGIYLPNIKDSSMNNICADNFPNRLTAMYEPNTITLNWDYKDETGRTEQTQCVYDTPITDVPETPVRAGYKFMGWRVKVPE